MQWSYFSYFNLNLANSNCRDFILVQLTEEKAVLKDAIKDVIYLCIYLRSYVSGTGLDAG